MEEPEQHPPHPVFHLQLIGGWYSVGGLELLSGGGKISPSHQHQKCIMNVLQTCPSRVVGVLMYLKSQRKLGFELTFCLPLKNLGSSASQKVKHWRIEVIHYKFCWKLTNKVHLFSFADITFCSELPELQEWLDNALRNRVGLVGYLGRARGWTQWSLWIPSNFCDSVKIGNAIHTHQGCKALLVPNQSWLTMPWLTELPLFPLSLQ